MEKRKRRIRPPSLPLFFVVCIAWLLASAGLRLIAAEPVVFHLINGDRITGVLVLEDAAGVTLTNSIVGRMTIPRSGIARREALASSVVVAPPPKPAATNAPVPAVPPDIQRKLDGIQTLFVTGALSAEEFQRRRTELVLPSPRPRGPKLWTAEVFAGLDLLFSEKDRQLYTGRAKITYAKSRLRHNLDYLFTYGWTDGELTANRMDGWLKTDWDLTSRTYLYNLGGAGYDSIRQVDWRYEIGPGVGYHLIKRTNTVLRVEGGFHYQVQDFEGSREEKSYSQRLAQDFRWNLGKQLSFDEKLEYFPSFESLHVYRLRGEANLRYWLDSNLSLNLTVIDTYDTKTARRVGQNDLQIKSSIGLKF